MRKLIFLAVLLLSSAIYAQPQGLETEFSGQSCTSIMVGRLASTDGSVITSHTCDGRYRTWAYMEPAADHAPGTMHQVLRGTMHTAFRGDTTGIKVMGEIPEVAHTYAYFNTAYPCMNEKQLAIGETTFTGPEILINEAGWFTIEELERVALQRCDNARDAIRTMGSLAEQYGYGDGGECLTIADKNEVWQFEITGVGKDKIGAAWVAQRVPDDHIAVSANIPRIGKIDRSNKDYFMASDNVEQVAKDNGLWNGKGKFVYWKAYNCDYAKGRNFHDREFFILNHFAPSLGLTYDMDEIPFSVKPEKKVDVRDVTAMFRETYEGTDFDMTKNMYMARPARGEQPADTIPSPVANPWVTTSMMRTINTIAPETITFRRTVAVAWCSYTHVTQLRNWLPDEIGGICWFSVDNPGQSPRIPVFCGTTELPEAFNFCGQKAYDPDYLLWQFRKANKLATLSWPNTKKGFQENIMKIEKLAFEGLPQTVVPTATLNAYTRYIYETAVKVWKEMEGKYWVQFGQGF